MVAAEGVILCRSGKVTVTQERHVAVNTGLELPFSLWLTHEAHVMMRLSCCNTGLDSAAGFIITMASPGEYIDKEKTESF